MGLSTFWGFSLGFTGLEALGRSYLGRNFAVN